MFQDLQELVVGDRFWLKRAQTMINEAPAAQIAAAARLQAGITWFWTVYAATAFILATTGKISIIAASWMTAPAFFLLLAYTVATFVTMPVRWTFDPRIPDEVERAYTSTFSRRRRALIAAQVLTALAAFAVMGTTFAVAPLASGKAPALTAHFEKSDPPLVHVVAQLPPHREVKVQGRMTSSADPFASTLQKTDSTGRLLRSLIVPMAPSYSISVSWAEGNETVTRTVEVKGN